jgi:hypothetical protein
VMLDLEGNSGIADGAGSPHEGSVQLDVRVVCGVESGKGTAERGSRWHWKMG